MRSVMRGERYLTALLVGCAASCASAAALDSGAYRCELSDVRLIDVSGEMRETDVGVSEFTLYAYGPGEPTELTREAPGASLQYHGEDVPAVAARIGASLFASSSNLLTSEDGRLFVQRGAAISFSDDNRFVATGPSPSNNGEDLVVYYGRCARQR